MTNNDELVLQSEERIKAIANGAQMLMGESRQLAATALYWKEQSRIATDAFQQAGIMQVKAEDKIEILLAERDGDKRVIAENAVLFETLRQEVLALERDVDAANARVDTKCAQLCNQDEQIEMLSLRIAELEAGNFSRSAVDVLAERRRQVTAEGWTPEHDDTHESGELAGAAACYARHVNGRQWVYRTRPESYTSEAAPNEWPWDEVWWKPKSPRSDLVHAAALILAEIERLDRAAGIKVEVEEV